MRLLIDGYNLMGSPAGLHSDLEQEREELLRDLTMYHRRKKADIVVVFDGWDKGWPIEKTERRGGLTVVFSKLGEKADLVIKRRIEAAKGEKSILISSDREIANLAGAHGWDVIPSALFQEKLQAVFYEVEYGKEDDEDEPQRSKKGKNRGNPRKLPKAERRKGAIVKKL